MRCSCLANGITEVVSTGVSQQAVDTGAALPEVQSGLAPSGKSVIYKVPGACRENFMPARFSELVEISKLNGDFKRNYGTLIGAFLYLRLISAARGRSFFWIGFISIAWSAVLTWSTKHGLAW